jgi:hypothetical protein
MTSTLSNRFDAAARGVRVVVASGLGGLRVFLVGRDARGPGGLRPVAWILAVLAAAYLTYGGTTYLDAKSGLPFWLCAMGGAALAAPLVLVVDRPLMAWRVALVAALVTGTAVQVHHRTPFSWHPAVLVALAVVLYAVVRRYPAAVSIWAWASMAVLITVSFYPADRLPLIAIVTVPAVAAALIRRRRSPSSWVFATGRQPNRNRTAAAIGKVPARPADPSL